MYGILIIFLTAYCLAPWVVHAGDKPDLTYIVEVCTKAYPKDANEIYACITKTAGIDGPPPTQQEVASLYGAPDDPNYVQNVHEKWGNDLKANMALIQSCKGGPHFRECLMENGTRALAIHDNLMDSLKPSAWPKGIAGYAGLYGATMGLQRMTLCESSPEAEKDQCMKQVVNDSDTFLLKGWDVVWNKVFRWMKRAEGELADRYRETSDRMRNAQQDAVRAQREHELELARIRALGLILGNGGPFRPIQPPPTYQPQPVPVPTLPSYQPNPVRPPVSCTAREVGGVLHTDCY